MATTVEIDAALAELKAARMKLFEASQQRNNAVLRRDRLIADVAALNQNIVTARNAMTAARTKVQTLLAETETMVP